MIAAEASALLLSTLQSFITLYGLLILIRVLLTWFQTAPWAYNAMAVISPVTDPYLNLFRRFIPPLGGIDFSPIIAIFVLQFVGRALGAGF